MDANGDEQYKQTVTNKDSSERNAAIFDPVVKAQKIIFVIPEQPVETEVTFTISIVACFEGTLFYIVLTCYKKP